jgi:hypothetical protein
MHSILILLLLLTPLTSAAEAVCPCWTTEELRSAVAATSDDPVGEDDTIVSRCELSVVPFAPRLSARLTFQNLIGDRSEGAIVDFNSTDQRCIVVEEGLGLGLVSISVVGLSEEEASACTLRLGEVCHDLLPEPSSSVLLGAGVTMLVLMAKARGTRRDAHSRPVDARASGRRARL